MPRKALNATGKQRADLTFKHNIHEARHGWLRLTPAYSVKLVEKILNDVPGYVSVLDPFSGTATTALCAAMRGHNSVSIEINPFLAWFGQAKVVRYENQVLESTLQSGAEISRLATEGEIKPADPPLIHNIARWWNSEHLSYLCALKAGIDHLYVDRSPVKDLLEIALCRTLIRLSNAAFNHQSMSFKPQQSADTQLRLWQEEPLADPFHTEVSFVARAAGQNPEHDGIVLLGDSRAVDELLNRRFDLLITSPPYPNRMSYIRELRPYMYWLGYIDAARDAGEMDWTAIGGTWGIATSRLAEWTECGSGFFPDYLRSVVEQIVMSNSKSGHLLANYVSKYFEDIWQHIQSVRRVMKSGARVHYIVGNSKFYDTVVPVERIYSDMLARAGFRNVEIELIRKRNSKKELFEFDVHATA